ncbi:hypothetical protein [Asanoa sp. NPDC050611]|uniref:hypothetical protein n=1 Tax=Asanoa sp. NPDC050611 TaxID=3157098 RepID=UPI0033FF0CDD
MSSLKIRLAAGAAALAVAASVGASISSPALAAGPQLEMSYDTAGNVDTSGRLVGVYANNNGDQPASDVTLTFDASGLTGVKISVPDWLEGCALDGEVVTCKVPVIEAQSTASVTAFELTSENQSKPGAAGTLKGTISGFAPDGTENTGNADLDIVIDESGPDLMALSDDIGSKDEPVGGGDVRPVAAAIYNDGDSATDEWYIQISVPTGAGIVEQYSDCDYQDWWPGEHPAGYVYGPSVVTCAAPPGLELAPGDLLVFADAETDESLFHVAFGKNLRGPEEDGGSVQVGLVDDLRASKKSARKGSGESFADAVAKLKPTARAASRREMNTDNNWAEFKFWTKPNKYDFAVTAQAVDGNVGDTVEVPYTVINNGPSDGGASWTFKAPTGTVLVSDGGPWCRFFDENGDRVNELPEVTCSTEGEWPSKASGYQGVKGTVKVRINATPGDDGTLRVHPYPEDREADPANNEVKLAITTGGGGGGGGLPVTGANATLIGGIGGGVVVIGAVLFLVARRRRVVTVSE